MKAPALKKLTDLELKHLDTSMKFKPDKKIQKSSVLIRKTFSFERDHWTYLVTVAQQLSAARGKTVGASEALREVIERDMKRANP